MTLLEMHQVSFNYISEGLPALGIALLLIFVKGKYCLFLYQNSDTKWDVLLILRAIFDLSLSLLYE